MIQLLISLKTKRFMQITKYNTYNSYRLQITDSINKTDSQWQRNDKEKYTPTGEKKINKYI